MPITLDQLARIEHLNVRKEGPAQLTANLRVRDTGSHTRDAECPFCKCGRVIVYCEDETATCRTCGTECDVLGELITIDAPNAELNGAAPAFWRSVRFERHVGCDSEKGCRKVNEAIVGIDPKTKRCELVAIDSFDAWAECRDAGLIVVPTTKEKARAAWGEIVDDVYALDAPNVELEGRGAGFSAERPSRSDCWVTFNATSAVGKTEPRHVEPREKPQAQSQDAQHDAQR